MAIPLWNPRTGNEAVGRADLHVHSSYSDGLKTPEQLCAIAGRLGITHLALCDHDTVDGLDAMARAVREENRARASRGQPLLTLIPGVEISTGPGGRTHLLAYGASGRNAPLAAFLAGVSAERRMRAGRILDRLAEAGLTVTPKMRALPDIPSVGRAHFARALVESGQARDVHQAFDRYLSEGRPGYVPRASLPTGDTVAALSGMGLVVVLAHPMRLELERETLYALIREWKARGLRGVEAYHPSAGRRGARLLDALAREEGLLVTGGSDYHGDAGTRARMGRLPCGWRTSERDIAALMAAVDLAAPIDHLQKEQQDV